MNANEPMLSNEVDFHLFLLTQFRHPYMEAESFPIRIRH
jgi:hypothetical protein